MTAQPTAKFRWEQLSAADQTAVALSSKLNLHPLVVAYLTQQQKLTQPEAIEQFLKPTGAQLHDAHQLHDIDKAIEAIEAAVMANKKITVYGDYDVDGQTSTAIMYEALQTLGADVDYYVPSRFKDGYGPNLDRYKQLIAAGTQMIITVDNGVAGKEAVEYAEAHDVPVVITDHHELPDELPKATAIVHPRLPKDKPSYPFGGLCGAGVAFKVATALLESVPEEMLDLVALGTIADVMPLIDENRVLVYFGLKQLEQTERIGLQALLKNAKVTGAITDQTVGYTIAPRLNSLGRLADANMGVELLTEIGDEAHAKELAAKVEELNQHRKQLTDEIYAAASKQVQAHPDHEINVVAGPNWHQGVVGIVAARIQEETKRPTVVFGINEETHKATGSGRSIPGFDLFAALSSAKDLYDEFGGHAQACGLTLPADNLPQLQTKLDQYAKDAELAKVPLPKILVWGTLQLSEVNQALYDQLQVLAPFGEANKQPYFEFSGLRVSEVKQLSDGKHLSLTLQDVTNPRHTIKALAWNDGKYYPAISANPAALQFVGALAINEFRGKKYLQIIIQDMKMPRPADQPSADKAAEETAQTETAAAQTAPTSVSHSAASVPAAQPAAAPRANTAAQPTITVNHVQRLLPQLFTLPATYVCFDRKLADNITANLKANQSCVWAPTVTATTPLLPHIIMVDAPASLATLTAFLKQVAARPAGAFAQLTGWFYAAGMQRQLVQPLPNRNQFAALYRMLAANPVLDGRTAKPMLAQKLNLTIPQVNFMLEVFLAAKFVKMVNGSVNFCGAKATVTLSTTAPYQRQQALHAVWQQLIQPDAAVVTAWLQQQL